MGFLRRVFGGARPARQDDTSPAASAGTPRVSGNRYWRCPACGAVQGKPGLDSLLAAGATAPQAEPVACSKCGRDHEAGSVYGGSLDFTGEAEVLSRAQVAQRYLEAEMAGDANAVEALLASEAVHSSMRGETVGAKAIAERLRNPQGPGAGMMGRLQWGAPVESEGRVTIDGKPSMPNAPFPGLTMTLTFNEANKIERIELGRREG